MNKHHDDEKINKKVTKSFCSLFCRSFKNGIDASDENFDNSLNSPMKLVLKKLFSNKTAIIGMFFFLVIFLFSFIGSIIVPINETYLELTHANLKPGINYLNVPKELENKEVIKISSGISFSAAITADGMLYIWGTESNKEQGKISSYVFDVPDEVYENKIIDIACGGNHIVVIDENGNLYAWGYNGNGQLDIPNNVQSEFKFKGVKPMQMEAKSNWTAILGDNKELYIWGSTQVKMDMMIPSSLQGHIVKFAGGDTNIALLLDDGTVAVIGDRGSEFSMSIPKEVTDKTVEIIDIASSNKNVLVLDENGKVYTWGSSQDELLDMPNIDEEIISVHAGYRNLLAVGQSNEIYAWGNDIYSQLDIPNNTGIIKNLYTDFYQFYIVETDGSISSFGNKGFLFGTDQFGRDIMTRIIHGGKVSLTVGAIAVVISTTIALIIGLVAGYFGGIVDIILMRIADVFSSIPFYPIAITLSYAIGYEMTTTHKMYLIMVILGLLGWMSLARFIRAQLLVEREKDFVLAARALGIKNTAIMWKHILPNIMSLIIVNITLSYASSLLSESALSFLGFGVAEPTPSWGNMLNSAQDIAVIEFYWWRWLIPALFVIMTALSINIIGDALREALDPKTSER